MANLKKLSNHPKNRGHLFEQDPGCAASRRSLNEEEEVADLGEVGLVADEGGPDGRDDAHEGLDGDANGKEMVI